MYVSHFNANHIYIDKFCPSASNTLELSFELDFIGQVLSNHMDVLGMVLDNVQLYESSRQEAKRSQVTPPESNMKSIYFYVCMAVCM